MWAWTEKSWLGKLVTNISDAAKYKEGGYSWRKIFSVPCLVIAIKITLAHTTPTNLDVILNSWLIFIAFILGLVTVQQVLQFKNGVTSTIEDKTSSSSSTTTTQTAQS